LPSQAAWLLVTALFLCAAVDPRAANRETQLHLQGAEHRIDMILDPNE
jgi:hypothetical protein